MEINQYFYHFFIKASQMNKMNQISQILIITFFIEILTTIAGITLISALHFSVQYEYLFFFQIFHLFSWVTILGIALVNIKLSY